VKPFKKSPYWGADTKLGSPTGRQVWLGVIIFAQHPWGLGCTRGANNYGQKDNKIFMASAQLSFLVRGINTI
jgi:hypothetical protein